jgi:energy-coupling factor transporter ATP-binding protein EcfA2
MPARSKLISLKLRNIGCIGPDGLEVALDDIVCLVGRNNCGKSTVLRAYELAQGSQALTAQDRCQWTPDGEFPEIELVVHVPDGIPNVDAKWKEEKDGLRLVRSRWVWKDVGAKPTRQTWDPEIHDWAEDGKAGGADNVFNSRLPQPLRVGSLQDSQEEHDKLLRLVTEPVLRELKIQQETVGSPLRLAMNSLIVEAMKPVNRYQKEIDAVGTKVGTGFRSIFPELEILIRVGMEAPNLDLARCLSSGSSIRFLEEATDTAIGQQGTGSQRALFWALLQVRNTIVREQKAKNDRLKEAEKLKKEREKELGRKKPDDAKVLKLAQEIEALTEPLAGLDDDVALPGHILLIDEPENALHPMAVRAARDHLYTLAQDPNWQVMLSTHSPYFINPLQDHTSILRLERNGKRTTPRTFRTSTAGFSDEDKANLRALLQLDAALAEMFFGSYPIVVEGDTELASFMAAVVAENDLLSTQVALIPSRGKSLVVPLIRLLRHFKIDFGVVHDSDSPMLLSGRKNGAWKVNLTIAEAIAGARQAGTSVRHRVSVPDFERFLGGIEESKDKPILAYRKVCEDAELKNKVKELFVGLLVGESHQPLPGLNADSTADAVADAIKQKVQAWAKDNAPGDKRYEFLA